MAAMTLFSVAGAAGLENGRAGVLAAGMSAEPMMWIVLPSSIPYADTRCECDARRAQRRMTQVDLKEEIAWNDKAETHKERCRPS